MSGPRFDSISAYLPENMQFSGVEPACRIYFLAYFNASSNQEHTKTTHIVEKGVWDDKN